MALYRHYVYYIAVPYKIPRKYEATSVGDAVLMSKTRENSVNL